MGTLCKGDRCKRFATAESEAANAGYCGRDEYAGNLGDRMGWVERRASNGCDRIMLAAACNGVRNIDDAIRGAVVVAGNRGGAIRIEGVRRPWSSLLSVVRERVAAWLTPVFPPPSASAETGSRVKNIATARMALKSRSRGVRMV